MRPTVSFTVGAGVVLMRHLLVDLRYNGQFRAKHDVVLPDGQQARQAPLVQRRTEFRLSVLAYDGRRSDGKSPSKGSIPANCTGRRTSIWNRSRRCTRIEDRGTRTVAQGARPRGGDAPVRRPHGRGWRPITSKYGHISPQVIDQCFAGGFGAADAPADRDVIVYGNNGNIVRARTVNQQRLVGLYDKCDLLFAVGPAGSGKTYTAIALAVRA